MKLRTTIIGVALVFVLLFSMNTASALGISAIEFGEVKAGDSVTKDMYAYQSSSESANFFTYVILDNENLNQWITVEPDTFYMGGDYGRPDVKVTLNVPEDAAPGEYDGWIKIRGSNVFGTGDIGFTVATMARIHVTVPPNDNPIPEPTPTPTPIPAPDPLTAVEITIDTTVEPLTVMLERVFKNFYTSIIGMIT